MQFSSLLSLRRPPKLFIGIERMEGGWIETWKGRRSKSEMRGKLQKNFPCKKNLAKNEVVKKMSGNDDRRRGDLCMMMMMMMMMMMASKSAAWDFFRFSQWWSLPIPVFLPFSNICYFTTPTAAAACKNTWKATSIYYVHALSCCCCSCIINIAYHHHHHCNIIFCVIMNHSRGKGQKLAISGIRFIREGLVMKWNLFRPQNLL